MEALLKFSTLLIVCMLVAAPMASDAAITCDNVTKSLSKCVTYLTGGFIQPACCPAVRSLKSMAVTPTDRKQVCRCIQGAAKAMGSRLNTLRAANLPSRCGVQISFPISAQTNCNNVS